MTSEEKIITIKKLREITGAGMCDCRRALEETEWNIESAIEYLKIMPSRYYR